MGGKQVKERESDDEEEREEQGDIHKTKNRLMVAFDSNKGPNLKVVKWC